MTIEQAFVLAEKIGFQDDFGRWNFTNDNLLDFVFMVEETEREACAKLAENGLIGHTIAKAIRARGEK